ncbi:MAG: radical SAM protein [Sedimentisphaerales bacterium]|nr:radical SAM protein [Sedimentisphaerales bacterium]
MRPVEKLIEDFRKTIGKVPADQLRKQNLLSDPQGLLDIFRQGEQRRLGNESRYQTPIPRFCIFSVTWKCNLRCVGCYARRYASQGDLQIPEIEAIIRRACELGTYIFMIAGGEPLLVPDLLEILASIKQAFFFLFTNGTLVRDCHAEILSKTYNILPILSIEGPESITDGRRGSGVGARLNEAMRLLTGSNIAFGFSTMVTHANLRTVLSRQWMDTMWDSGARYGFLIDYIPFPSDRNGELALTEEDMREKEPIVEVLNSEGRPLLTNFPAGEYINSVCQGAGRGFIHINADGNVEPCPFSHYAKDNVRDKDLIDILRSDFFTELRGRTAAMANPTGGCLLFENQQMVESVAAGTGAFCTERVGRTGDCGELAGSGACVT